MSLQASVTAGAFTRAHVYYTRATWCLLVCEWVGIRWITRQFGTVCMVWHDMVWYDMVWYGTAGARCSHVGVAGHSMTWHGMARYGMVEVCEGLDRTDRHSLLVRCATQSLLVFGSGCGGGYYGAQMHWNTMKMSLDWAVWDSGPHAPGLSLDTPPPLGTKLAHHSFH